MFKNLLGSWYLKKKISNGFLGEGLVFLKSKKLNNFHYEEKSLTSSVLSNMSKKRDDME